VKDIVANRRRVSLSNRVRTALIALRENGPIWCTYLFAYYLASTIAERAHSKMHQLRRERNLPGLNSATLNQHIWNSWDWSAQGDEWTSSPQWKESLIRRVLQPNIPPNSAVLEIGPGAGRWTEALLQHAQSYIGVDISASCVEVCSKRFAGDPRAQFLSAPAATWRPSRRGQSMPSGASTCLYTSTRQKWPATSRILSV